MLHSIWQQIWKTQQWPQDWKRSVFIPISKKGNTKGCSNYHTIALISHASKVTLKILQTTLQQYVDHKLSDVQAGFRKGKGTRDQIANIHWIIEKARVPEKHLLLRYWLCQSLWLCGSQQTVENSEQYGNEYQTTWPASWEICMQVRKQQLVVDMEQQTGSKIRKGVHQGCILSSCLFNLYAEHIMRNAGLDEAQAGIKIAGRNINNLRYADDTNLNGRKWRNKEPLDESERGEWKSWLKVQHSEN